MLTGLTLEVKFDDDPFAMPRKILCSHPIMVLSHLQFSDDFRGERS